MEWRQEQLDDGDISTILRAKEQNVQLSNQSLEATSKNGSLLCVLKSEGPEQITRIFIISF